MYLSVCLSVCLSIYLSIYPSIHLSICLSVCLSIYLAIYLSTYLSTGWTWQHQNRAISRDFLNVWTWQRQKRSNSARLLHFSKLTTSKTKQFCENSSIFDLTTSKTKQFCETSSFFKLVNIKIKAILRDFLQKWKVACSADGLVPMRFAIFPVHLSKLLRLPRKSDARSYDVLHLSRKIISANLKIWGSKMQPLLGNQCTDNSSDADVSSAAPATENASTLQILFKCPTPAIVFGNATKPPRFSHFWQGAQSLAPATRNDISTSKSGPNPWCF